jgi:hypothetical protein
MKNPLWDLIEEAEKVTSLRSLANSVRAFLLSLAADQQRDEEEFRREWDAINAKRARLLAAGVITE